MAGAFARPEQPAGSRTPGSGGNGVAVLLDLVGSETDRLSEELPFAGVPALEVITGLAQVYDFLAAPQLANSPDVFVVSVGSDVANLGVIRAIRSVLTIARTPIVCVMDEKASEHAARCYSLGANSVVFWTPSSGTIEDSIGEILSYWLRINLPTSRAF